MMTHKSPFCVKQNFISPLLCEQLVSALQLREPDTNKEGKYLPLIVRSEECEELLFEKVQPLISLLEEYYPSFQYKGTESISFEWYPANCSTSFRCENSEYLRKKWVKVRERDVTAVIFFSDFNDKPPFESEYESYGGKLEFPQHKFGFNPQRGTMILYPSGPHFINMTTPVDYGDLFQAKIHFASKVPYLHTPDLFGGDYRSWFKEFV